MSSLLSLLLQQFPLCRAGNFIISALTDPNSEFQGTEGNVYILAWTITASCGSSTDRVIIYFSPCQNQNNDYSFADLTDPLSYEGNSWTDAGWADVNVPAAENQIISCLVVTASKLCTDGYPEEVTLYLKSPSGTVIQIWEGAEENGCTDDFVFMTETRASGTDVSTLTAIFAFYLKKRSLYKP